MSDLRGEIEGLAEAAAPEIGVPVMAVKAAFAVVVAILLGWMVWKLFFADRQAQQKHDEAQIKAGQLVGSAHNAAAGKAVNIVAKDAAAGDKIHEITRDHYVEITRQPGASDPVSDAVDAAGRRAVCMRVSAAGLPDCQRLRETDPGQLEGGRSERAPAGGQDGR